MTEEIKEEFDVLKEENKLNLKKLREMENKYREVIHGNCLLKGQVATMEASKRIFDEKLLEFETYDLKASQLKSSNTKLGEKVIFA